MYEWFWKLVCAFFNYGTSKFIIFVFVFIEFVYYVFYIVKMNCVFRRIVIEKRNGSTGFDDFFLFDDYYYFLNYKLKTLEFVKAKYAGTKYENATKTGLTLLDDFYRHRDFYLNIDSFGTINTATYADYSSLPNLEYDWNKYLLVGILRTYLSSEFIVENTGGTYKTTEYTVSIR